jgi:hypothetical protein
VASLSESLYRQRDDVLAEEVLGETILLDAVEGRYVRLNRTGALLWHALAEPRTEADLAALLHSTHGIALERGQADAQALLAALLARGLVTQLQ